MGVLLCLCACAIHAMLQLFFQHVIVHLMTQKLEKDVSSGTFEEAAAKTACSWFNANHVHCLRSKYVHSQEPPCVPYVNGREDLLRRNVEAGAFFDGGTFGRDASKTSEARKQISKWKE